MESKKNFNIFPNFMSNRSLRSRTRIQIRIGMIWRDADLDPVKFYRSDRIPIRNHNNGLIDDIFDKFFGPLLSFPLVLQEGYESDVSDIEEDDRPLYSGPTTPAPTR
jgi:hypothetical protein